MKEVAVFRNYNLTKTLWGDIETRLPSENACVRVCVSGSFDDGTNKLGPKLHCNAKYGSGDIVLSK